MKQKQVKKKAEVSAPKKKVVVKKKVEQKEVTEEELIDVLKAYKPNHFKFAMYEFGFAFRSLWLGIKGLFKK